MDRKYRILQVGVEVNSGSTGKITENIGLVAIQNGFDSFIAYARGFNPSESKTIKIGNKLNIFFHLITTRIFGNHLRGSWIATYLFIRKVKKINPDIIHLHQIHGYYLNFPLFFRFLNEFGKPIVWTLHDCWAFTGHCCHFYLENCSKWKTNCFECPKINKYPASLFFDSSKESFDQKKYFIQSLNLIVFIGVSEWMSNLARQSFLKERRIETILNGVNISSFVSKNLSVNSPITKKIEWSKKILIAVGTEWNSNKGLDDYCKLSKMLDDSYTIVLVGLPIEKIQSLPNNIIGIKRTESLEVLSHLYRNALVLLCLSKLESFGLTPIEAFACGTPAVVYDNSALSELITPETGIKVETGNLNKVLEAIIEINRNGKTFYSDNCSKVAENIYDIRLTYQKYINLYKDLIENLKPPNN